MLTGMLHKKQLGFKAQVAGLGVEGSGRPAVKSCVSRFSKPLSLSGTRKVAAVFDTSDGIELKDAALSCGDRRFGIEQFRARFE